MWKWIMGSIADLVRALREMFRRKFIHRDFTPPSCYAINPMYFSFYINNDLIIVLSRTSKLGLYLLECERNVNIPNLIWFGDLMDPLAFPNGVNVSNLESISQRTHQVYVLIKDDWNDPQSNTRVRYYKIDPCKSPYIELTGELSLNPRIVAVDGDGLDVVVVQENGTIHVYENNTTGTLIEKYTIPTTMSDMKVSRAFIRLGLIYLEYTRPNSPQWPHGIMIRVREGLDPDPSKNWFQYLYQPQIDSPWLIGNTTIWNCFPEGNNFSYILFSGGPGEFKVYYNHDSSPGILELVRYKNSANELFDSYNFPYGIGNGYGLGNWHIRSTNIPTKFEGIWCGVEGILHFFIDVDISSTNKYFVYTEADSIYTQSHETKMVRCFYYFAKNFTNLAYSINDSGKITLEGIHHWFPLINNTGELNRLMYESGFSFTQLH